MPNKLTVVSITDNTHRRVKQYCNDRGIKMGHFIERLILKKLDNDKS
jgi:hypothetical protein